MNIASFFNGFQPINLIIAALATILVVLIIFMVLQHFSSEQDDSERMVDQVMDTFQSEIETDDQQEQKHEPKRFKKWNRYWETRIIGSGMKIPLITHENVGSRMGIFFAIVFVLGSALFQNIIAGAILAVATGVIISTLLGFVSDRRNQRISGQVPGFLASMRASLQNGAIPENALKSAIKDADDDLYEELRPLESELLAGGDTKETLKRYYNETSIDELRFLMSCIIVSINKGKDLDPQLGIIQGIVEARARRRRDIQRAVNEVQPTVIICSAVIPLLFLYMYFVDSTAHQFWFKSLTAWLFFILALVVWWFGLYLVKKIIDGVKALG